ncbi:MAG: M1 family metallopeptidase [Acidimicrobiales bacterium]
MSHRLPRTILPSNYRVELTPDLDAFTFGGTVRITAEVIEPTDQLICNVADLELWSVSIDGVPATHHVDTDAEQLVVDLGDVRGTGPIRLEAEFAGVLNDQLRGFYRSTYEDDDGTTRVIATTQFQSTDARRAFPCFDEPDMKATFDITLNVDPAHLAVSNGAEVSRSTRDDGLHSVTFAQTMVMSSYLVAFVVGPLEATPPAMAGDVPVRIVHRPGRGHLTGFAIEVATAALAYFENYYGIPYPTDKLDMIALPDFAMGAMENLGCITYREILLLVDPSTATQPELENVTDVINHELAHMWFGDLVTMSWWNGIWLNEAFATFMEMKATDSFRPGWQRWTSFGTSRTAAFDVDSLDATRPIEFPVVSPDDAEGMFDVLTYEKGAAVVRMLEQWLGEDTFRDGIRQYLQTHLYANTETHDLWNALEEVAGRPVRAAMETWIFQGGYPLIELADGELHQRRFRYGGSGSDATWIVPVQARRMDGQLELVELSERSGKAPFESSDVLTLNHAAHGFYRVRLPDDRLAALAESGFAGLDPVERYGVVDDTWALTLGGDISVDTFLRLAEGYRNDDDVSVWQRVVGALGFLHHVAPDDTLPALGGRIAQIIDPIRDRLGADVRADDSPRLRQLRGTLLSAAGIYTDDDEALALAARIHGSGDPDAELLAASVKVIAANGTQREFDDFRHRFQIAESPQDEMRYLYALPIFPAAESIGELTDMALSGTIRKQNAPFVLAQALMNRAHGPAVWERLAADWDDISEQFPSNTIVRLLTGVRWLTDRALADDVIAFFAGRPLPQGQKQLDQHLERLAVNAEFASRVAVELPGALT